MVKENSIVAAMVSEDVFSMLEFASKGEWTPGFEKLAKEYDPELFEKYRKFVRIYGKVVPNEFLSKARNVDKSLKSAIVRIFEKMPNKYDFVLWGWTSLAILGYIDRVSEDVDVFIAEGDYAGFCSDFSRIFGIKLEKTERFGNHVGLFPSTERPVKIELVHYEKSRISERMVLKDVGIPLMSVMTTFHNKLDAGVSRNESRDIYDLAMYRIKLGMEKFYAHAWRNSEKYANRIDRCLDDQRLLKVLKHPETDMEILKAFKKDLHQYANARFKDSLET